MTSSSFWNRLPTLLAIVVALSGGIWTVFVYLNPAGTPSGETLRDKIALQCSSIDPKCSEIDYAVPMAARGRRVTIKAVAEAAAHADGSLNIHIEINGRPAFVSDTRKGENPHVETSYSFDGRGGESVHVFQDNHGTATATNIRVYF